MNLLEFGVNISDKMKTLAKKYDFIECINEINEKVVTRQYFTSIIYVNDFHFDSLANDLLKELIMHKYELDKKYNKNHSLIVLDFCVPYSIDAYEIKFKSRIEIRG